ncbi:hypothetical protein EVAR_68005_1 [Eumeta japonica]|uniref:Reverse transcriptase domain-containing protein n=1 Tax=Eumeta variegata TaxID=151549 RepID=A0A4C1ST51_EUMVA|nr:hypothetical protein EVAR_68005_1 [Eumeta japonica]
MDELFVKRLLYADNHVMLAPSACVLQEIVNKMNDPVKKSGMKVNFGKTKEENKMCEILTSKCKNGSGSILIRNEELELVDTTVFLGLTLDNKLQWVPYRLMSYGILLLDMLRMFTEFSFCKSGPFAQFTGWDLVFLLETDREVYDREVPSNDEGERQRIL